jgi:hypothetical protein
MRGATLQTTNKSKIKNHQSQPPHPSPLPQEGEGTVATEAIASSLSLNDKVPRPHSTTPEKMAALDCTILTNLRFWT